MSKLNIVYHNLLNSLTPQGWWPLTKKGFHPKHHSGRPKTAKHKLEIIIGAILTQYRLDGFYL